MLRFFLFSFLFSLTIYFLLFQQNKYSANDLAYYYALDRTLKQNTEYIEHYTENTLVLFEEQTKRLAYLKPLLKPIKTLPNLSKELNNYIDQLRETLGKKSGGFYTEVEAQKKGIPTLAGLPKNGHDEDSPALIFISGDKTFWNNKPQGPILEQKIIALRKSYLQCIRDLWNNGGVKGTIFFDPTKMEPALEDLNRELPLINSKYPTLEKNKKESWSKITFSNKPIAAVYLILREIQNDIQLSETAVVNFLMGQYSSNCNYPYIKNEVFAMSQNPCIKLGESYQAEITLGTYSSEADFSVYVNDEKLSINNGRATYNITPTHIGRHKYEAKIGVKNPLTGKVSTIQKTFYYEVGE